MSCSVCGHAAIMQYRPENLGKNAKSQEED